MSEAVRIYHNPRCSKSRETLQLLQSQGIEPEVVAYLENPPSPAELEALLQKLTLSARDLLRTGEDAYKELNLNDPALTDAQLIEVMVANPKLIQRPIVVKGQQAALGRPPEAVLALFD